MRTDRRPGTYRLSETNRVEAFSDGVFAIALTLLVLDLHAPEGRGDFAGDLGRQWPAYAAYLASFLNIASIWINHHELFSRVRRVDIRLVCINLIVLLVASLFPWPAAVISAAEQHGTSHDRVVATVLFAGFGLLIPLTWILMMGYLRRNLHLMKSSRDAVALVRAHRRSYLSLIVYPLAAVLAFLNPVISLIAYIFVPSFFLLALVFRPLPFDAEIQET